MNRNEIVKELEAGRDRMVRQFAAPAADQGKSYGAGKWTVRQILAHVSDCEFINLWRFLRAVAEPGSNVEVFEENDWAKRLDYDKRPPEVSRDIFLGARNMLIHHMKTLPDDRLETSCKHPQKGELPGWRWARLTTGHSEHHLGQIEAARSGKPWVRTTSPDDKLYGAKTTA
jgi:DinB superfamily